MRILISLPKNHPPIEDIDAAIAGEQPLSGTTGSIVRIAALLKRAGFNVALSGCGGSRSGVIDGCDRRSAGLFCKQKYLG